VINYDFPARDASQYVHRIGRTGRNGKYGQAISFLSPSFRQMKNFPLIYPYFETGNCVMPKELRDFQEEEDSD